MPKIIDLTHTITDKMPVHALDEPVSLQRVRFLSSDSYNDWKLCAGMHVGTHIDGPGHLTDVHMPLSELAVDRFVGQGYLIDARGKTIDVSLLNGMPAQDGLIVFVLTGFDKKFGSSEYFTDHPVMTTNFAMELVSRRVKMVGIDCFSPDRYPFPVHQLLFENNILIIENLTNLEQLVGVKTFTVAALPLKTETDSALARVVAIVGANSEN